MPRITRLLAPNPSASTLTGTNTYLLDADGVVAVVDPGPDDATHLRAVLDAAEPLGRVKAVLVTHGHADHLPAAVPLAAATGAPFVGHANLAGVQRPLADGETLAVGPALTITAVDTPGHTDDSLCYWEPAIRALFTGDLVAGSGSLVVDDRPGGLARSLASLRRLQSLGPCAIYPGHGPVVDAGQAKLTEYLAHRAEREQQILAVLGHGPQSAETIVGVVYPDLPPALLGHAARNVRAHLGKLADEGRVVSDPDGRWRL
jgi:glyoxylase-like metal-dependent hydrolase (beta-lactamase superfamily II)